MAGDWIKVEKATARKPEVLQIADLLQIHPDMAFGLCVRFWMWADDQLTDGHAPSVTPVTLDYVIGFAGISTALIKVGWLRVREGSLEVPNFDRHLSESAKKRALSGKRQKKHRLEDASDTVTFVTPVSRSQRDNRVTREEKRKEELHTSHTRDRPDTLPAPPDLVDPDADSRPTFLAGESPAFRRFFEAYPKKRAPGKAWRVWQSVVFGLIGSRGWTDAQAEEFLCDKAVLFASSPRGLPPPPGQTEDFRPDPAKWLEDGVYDEPYAEWMTPNLRGQSDGKSHQRGGRKRKPGDPKPPTENFDALFDKFENSGGTRAGSGPASSESASTASGVAPSAAAVVSPPG